jgi:hypothetical protein
MAVATSLQLLVLVAAVIVAGRQLRESHRTGRAQTRPYVVVYLELSRVSRVLVELVIENLGTTSATNVRIAFNPGLRSTLDQGDSNRLEEWTALKDGIAHLAPRQRLTTLLDSLISRYGADGSLPRKYDVSISYSDGVTNERYQESAILDVGVFFGSHYVTELGTHDVAKGIEEIGKTLNRWTEGISGLRVFTIDYWKDQKRRNKLMQERLVAAEPPSDASAESSPRFEDSSAEDG